MGQEISDTHFRNEDFQRFRNALHEETQLLTEWIQDRCFSDEDYVAGLELELCLVNETGQPAPSNEGLIDSVNSTSVVPELSKFNVEFNVDPCPLRTDGIQRLCDQLSDTWDHCRLEAKPLGLSVLSIGILPTLRDEHLVLKNMSPVHRYHALNEQVMRLRHGRPVRLDISGPEHLTCEHFDVTLEAGATSLQLHLQVPQKRAADAYNFATVLSAPMVALGANSPLLFGKRLWQETRIPLFEQAVAMDGPINRVTLGTGYAPRDISALFRENEHLFPVLLPLKLEQQAERLSHVRLHNGTIWRWNRPIIGFDSIGRPHIRIEHRVMAAGTTIMDMAAQIAFYYGLMMDLLSTETPAIEERLPFISAWTNFYDAARLGLKANVSWLDGKKWPVSKLILQALLPSAQRGLESLGVDSQSIHSWLQLISDRVSTGRTGAYWQADFFMRSGGDSPALVREYRMRQLSGEPVHHWSY
jgi:gamma-glutamyl:cysteine ligase YbdK (ATP-grasp superfamily)